MEKMVTILMSVHNESKEYLQTSINSILTQTYKNIEFLIIDDASNRECHNALEEIIKPYPFVKLIVNETNLGITESLFYGVKFAQGDYIARMDADDYSLPTRLEVQVKFMDENPKIDIIGGVVVSFGAKSMFLSPCNGMDDSHIKSELFFTSSLCHPSVMIRKSFLKKYDLNYDINVNKGQDYDFWERCSIFAHFVILKEVILYYRIHDNQITTQNKSEQVQTAELVMKRRLARIGIEPTKEEYEAHLALKGTRNCENIKMVKDWAYKLIAANAQKEFVNGKIFENNVKKRLAIVYAKQKKIYMKNFVPLSQYGLELIAMNLRLKKEKKLVTQVIERKCLL